MHHIVHWTHGGPTEYYNLVTVCGFHHAVIHKCNWDVVLEDGQAVWFRPLARRYEPGPAPPEHPPENSHSDPHRLGQAAGYSRMFDLVKLL